MTQELVQTACVAGLWHGLLDVLDRFVIDDALFVGLEALEITVLFMKYLEWWRESGPRKRWTSISKNKDVDKSDSAYQPAITKFRVLFDTSNTSA